MSVSLCLCIKDESFASYILEFIYWMRREFSIGSFVVSSGDIILREYMWYMTVRQYVIYW